MKIYGIGCDLVEVDRIKKASERESFIQHAFSKREIERFNSMNAPAQSMAAAWAAKEAFSKALHTGVRGFSLTEITISHDQLGAPFYELEGMALKAAKGLDLQLSLSHTKEYAQAFCVACTKEEN